MIKTFIAASVAAIAAATQSSGGLEQILAQLGLEAQSAKHTCFSVAKRNKEPVDNFY